MTYLTVPIAATNMEQVGGQLRLAHTSGAEMVELRTDYMENLSVPLVEKLIAQAKAALGASIPMIVTCRDKQQGGVIDYPDQLRVDVLTAAVTCGADFVDFEYDNFLVSETREKLKAALLENTKTKLILSAHNFETKFDNIEKLHSQMKRAYPAAIPKLVYTANHINDCFDAFDLLHSTTGDRIVFCMGPAGLISRIIAKKLGSFVTFASVNDKTATAPGQLTIQQFKELYRYDSIDTETELFGVIADPVAHSLSPAIHNACFTDLGANKLYLPLLVEGGKGGLDRFLNNVASKSRLGFKGFSVTIPHKQNALNYVKESGGLVEPLAERIGAANTIVIGADCKLSAFNTDYGGALDAIKSSLGIGRADLNGMAVAVIGAGGVARAIVAGLADAGAKIKIYNRTIEKARKLAAEFGSDFSGLDDLSKLNAKLLINCTSIGMHPNTDATPVSESCLKKEMAVFDTVYNPQETLLLKQAKQVGAKVISGLDMFINQAGLQFKLFTGENPNLQLMRKTISDCLLRH